MSDIPPAEGIPRPTADEGGGPARPLRRWLLAAVVLGAILWFVGAVVFFGRIVGVGPTTPGTWILWFQASQAVGEALCLGSAATLIGLFVVERWDPTSR
jgi:hypothetical protein